MTTVRAPLQLPTQLSLFPLSGIILLPFGHLPLTVFEPRFIGMIDDLLGRARILGVIQPKSHQPDPIPNDAQLFDIGTAGRIVHFTDLGDGRYHIILEGLSRFHIQGAHEINFAEQGHDGYRQAEVRYDQFEQDLQPQTLQDDERLERILNLMKLYFEHQEIDADWEAVADAPFEALVSSLTMSCPFAPEEKQALLQSADLQERANMLISLFEMNLDGGQVPGALKH